MTAAAAVEVSLGKKGCSYREFERSFFYSLASFQADHYVFVFCGFPVLYACMILLIVINLATSGKKITEVVSDGAGYDWTVYTHPSQINKDAVDSAYVQTKAERLAAAPVYERSLIDNGILFIYEWRDKARSDSIFTPNNLRAMCLIERLTLRAVDSDGTAFSDICALVANDGTAGKVCQPQTLSIVHKFYTNAAVTGGNATLGEVLRHDCTLLSRVAVSSISADIVSAVSGTDPMQKAMNTFYVSTSTVGLQRSERARSMLSAGQPLAGYVDSNDRKKEQQAIKLKFWLHVVNALFEQFNMKPPRGADYDSEAYVETLFLDQEYYYMKEAVMGEMSIKFLNGYVFGEEFNRLLWSDMMVCSVMLTFVFSYMCFHTQSFFLACLGFFQIIVSLPLSFCIYTAILSWFRGEWEPPYFPFANLLIIFIIMGIGADDLFVFVDGYRQGKGEVLDHYARQLEHGRDNAEEEENKDGDGDEETEKVTCMRRYACGFKAPITNKQEALKLQLAHGMERAMKSIFNTSFTTACAFLANLASAFAPLFVFGIFSAIVVLMNFFIVVTWTPAGVVLYHKWFKQLPFCGCCIWSQFCCPADRYDVPEPPTWCPGSTVAAAMVETTTTTEGAKEAEGEGEGDAGTSVVVVDERSIGSEEVKESKLKAFFSFYPSGPPSRELGVPLPVPPLLLASSDRSGADATMASTSEYESTEEKESSNGGKGSTMSLCEKFFDRIYTPMMLFPAITLAPKKAVGGGAATSVRGDRIIFLKLFSFFTIFIFTINAIVATVYAAQLRTPEEVEKWLPIGHMLQVAALEQREKFMQGANDEYAAVSLVFGVDTIDRTKNRGSDKPFDPIKVNQNRGTVVYDDAFSIGTVVEQEWILSTCAAIEAEPCTSVGCGGGTLALSGTTKCVLADLKNWIALSFANPGTVKMEAFGPVQLTANPSLYAAKSGDLPVGMTQMSAAFTEYYKSNRSALREEMAGLIGGKLKFIAIATRATLHRYNVQRKNEAGKVAWDRFVDAKRREAPPALKSLKHVSRSWISLVMQDGLVDGMLVGLAITFPVAFIVLLIATGSLIGSVFGIVAIFNIVVSVLGFCKAIMGWYLGIGETIAAVMIVGLSVDYVVHLGHMFLEHTATSESAFPSAYRWPWTKQGDEIPLRRGRREARFHFASVAMGSTVLGGAGTTFGAGMIMFACQFAFFFKFAVLIAVTIFYSLMYSLFFFMPLMAIFGPDGECGDLFFLCKHTCFGCVCKGPPSARRESCGEEVEGSSDEGSYFFLCKEPMRFLKLFSGWTIEGLDGNACGEEEEEGEGQVEALRGDDHVSEAKDGVIVGVEMTKPARKTVVV